MKYFIIPAFLLLYSFTVCSAQAVNNLNNNAFSFELGKTGLICNINFDHKIPVKDYGYRFGIGSNFSKYLSAFTTGGGMYYLFGKKENFFELGIDVNYLSVNEVSDDQKGLAIIYPDYTINTFYTNLNIGYRKYGKQSMFRIGFSPAIIKREFVPGGYVSCGLTF